MTDSELFFYKIAAELQGAEKSQMFGKACFKKNGKAFLCFFRECAVFKLSDGEHRAALSLSGSVLFDPSGKGRPMKEWVQVTFVHKDRWEELAEAAMYYIDPSKN